MRRVVLLFAVCGAACAAARTEPAVSREAARSAVGMTRRELVDPTRPRWEGSGPRPVVTLVWYPATPDAAPEDIVIGPPEAPAFRSGRAARGAAPLPGRFPLIVLSHGTGGSALQLMWLGQTLAARGYVVAAVNHHGNTGAEPAPLPQGMRLIWERARDLSVAIDGILADPELSPHVKPQQIGAAGFSLGGHTVIALAGGRNDLSLFEAFCAGPRRDATCGDQLEMPDAAKRLEALREDPLVVASIARAGADYRDPRVRAVVAIAPAVSQMFTDASLRSIGVPVLAIGGEADTIAPIATNASRLGELIPGAQLVRVASAHYTFLSTCGPSGPPPLCTDPAGIDRARVHADVADRAVTFFNRVLR